ncbi:MAG TPA: cupin domain-containing protein [Rhizomicrobium sp.]|nr:cupin domain-containing protein [Rhizomicrobium sp.]
MPKRIDPKDLPTHQGTFYPPPYHQPCKARERRKLGDAAGLTQYGVNLLRLPPGVWSSQRHWHTEQDEFVYVVSGEVVLVTDAGEEVLKTGDCAGFKAGDKDGHHLQNRSNEDALLLEIGTRTSTDTGEYSDIDMAFKIGGPAMYTHKDGTPYTDIRRRGPDDD